MPAKLRVKLVALITTSLAHGGARAGQALRLKGLALTTTSLARGGAFPPSSPRKPKAK